MDEVSAEKGKRARVREVDRSSNGEREKEHL